MDIVENLRIFKRLAEKQSFSGVASELGVTQPTISKAIAALERNLGVQLFRRSSRGLTMTAEGQKLLQLGAPALENLESAIASVKNEKLLLKGQLKISTPLSFAQLILNRLIDDFSKLHPDLRLNFALRDGLIDLVEEGIDLAIRHGEQIDSTLRALKVGAWKRAVYASTGYIKKFGKPKNLDDLKNHRLLFYNCYSEKTMWSFTEKGKTKQIFFEPYIQSDETEFVRENVMRGSGISLLPEWMMIEAEQKNKVVKMFSENCTEVIPIYLMSSRTQEMTAKQRAFADFIKARFDDCTCLSLRHR